VNTVPLAARPLRFGAKVGEPPQGARRSARKVSRLMRTTLGLSAPEARDVRSARASEAKVGLNRMKTSFPEAQGTIRPSADFVLTANERDR
jgi:hypothetical protein